MNDFTVSLFGHREIKDLRHLEARLAPVVKEIMRTHPYVSFLLGRNGEFDEFAASVIKSVQREVGKEKGDITLVLPYRVAGLEFYEEYYDNIVIPECVERAHYKSAITVKNRWMVEEADLVIVYVAREGGGASRAMKYAQKLGKRIVNLYREEGFPVEASR